MGAELGIFSSPRAHIKGELVIFSSPSAYIEE